MPAIKWDLSVEAGSWEPEYIVVTDPDSGELLDLTAPGWAVHGVVATRANGSGTVLADLPDGSVWRRTATGRIYFEPTPAQSALWTFRGGYHQVELTPPAGADRTVRIAAGKFVVNPELVIG